MPLPAMVSTILRSAAPTLLTALALPPPFNMIASAVVSGVMAKYLPPDQVPAQPSSAGSSSVLTPEQVNQIVEHNISDPKFVLELRQAEADLKKYELEAGIRFAELEAKERQDSRNFQRDTGMGENVFSAGMKLVLVALIGMLLVIIGSLVLVFGGVSIPPGSADVAVAAFGLIGTAVGFVNGVAANVVNFYWGSSQSSKEKGDAISETVRNLGEQLGRAASHEPPAPRSKPSMITDVSQYQTVTPTKPATPAPFGLLAEVMPSLRTIHRHFSDGAAWALTPEGVSVDGARAGGTAGDPKTVTDIWKRYGDLCSASAKRYGVPVELIVATIATESGGNPNARRVEAKIRDESIGLMQTLVKTARGALGRSDLKGDDLLNPALSIEAGTAYIAQQRGSTHFDPPLVAAAYNAGSIRRDSGEANRWKLLCFPTGTGQHIDRYVEWFADCMVVSTKQGWGQQEGVPSFAQCFAATEKTNP